MARKALPYVAFCAVFALLSVAPGWAQRGRIHNMDRPGAVWRMHKHNGSRNRGRNRDQNLWSFRREDRPRGWGHGRKTGWGACDVPPGQAKRAGCRPVWSIFNPRHRDDDRYRIWNQRNWYGWNRDRDDHDRDRYRDGDRDR